MPPQTQNPTQPQSLDQDVVNLAKAIRHTETGGKDVAGASGEQGSYQFMPETWKAYSSEAGINVPIEQATREQQNEVVYKKLKGWKDKGYNPGQIASMWNAGEGRPNAYKENFRGVNEKGVAYDTPAYAEKVANAYKEIKGKTVAEQKPDEDTNLLEKAINFAFPILEKKERTPLQTAGDIGLSALWFLPGLGGVASTALKGAGLAAKTAKTVGAISTGAGIGYGSDVASKLSEGKTGKEVLTPGLGTALGAGTAGLASRIAGKYSQKGVLEGIAKENNAVFGQTKRGANDLAESFSKNKNPGQLAAEKGVNLKQLVDPETVAYNTKDKVQEVINDGRVLNEVLTDALARTPGSKPVQQIEETLLAKIPKNYPERGDIVKREMQLLRQQYGENPTIADLNEWKQRNWNLGKFDMSVPNDTRLTHRLIGNSLKTDVETLAKAGGLKEVDAMNDYIGSHFDLADTLEHLNGTKAKGGRMGNLMRESALTTIGGVGGMFGAGPVGMLAGVLAGHYGAKTVSAILRKVEGSPIKSAILRRMIKEDPEVVQKVLKYAGKTPEELKGLKTQLGEKGIDIFKGKKIRPIAPKMSPKESGNGIIQGLISTAGARAGAQ